MAKKTETPKTFKPMPEVKAEVEVKKTSKGKVDNTGLLAELLTIEGVTEEMAEQMIEHGVPDDSFTVQTFYRVTALTADAVIEVFKREGGS